MITSLKNPLVKYVLKLKRKRAFRHAERRFVVEGLRETKRAIAGGFKPEMWLICPEILKKSPVYVKGEISEVSTVVYEHLAYRGGTEGILGIFVMRDFAFDMLEDISEPFVLIAEGIQKPGNMGAIMRTADGAGIDALIFINPDTDLYNPNVIRASLGTLFTQKIIVGTMDDLKRLKRFHRMKIFAATLQNSHIYWDEDYKGATGIAVGEEAEGLSNDMRNLADQSIYIPMHGVADSLNVSVATGILVYEALRQRNESR